MSENEKPVETPVCRKSSDSRTFCIALLTAIVVVAVYHVGTRLCRMFCTPGGCGKPAVTYMLIPIVKDGPGPMSHHGPFGGRGGFRHRRHMDAPEGGECPSDLEPGKKMMHKGGFRPGKGPGSRPDRPGKGPGFRKGPAPADAPAAAPADKAAPAPKAPAEPKQDAVTGATAKPAAK